MFSKTYHSERAWPWWRLALWSAPMILLALPALAMLLTSSVAWTAADFIVAALLLGSVTLMADITLRKVRSRRTATLLIGVLFMAVLVVWIELAVGLFGSPLAGS